MTAEIPVEIRTDHLPNKILERYYLTIPLGDVTCCCAVAFEVPSAVTEANVLYRRVFL
jgi:hypothetical protein